MTNPTKYFISNTNGVFINWYSNILGLETQGQSLEIVGANNDDAIYVGAGTVVDATGLTASGGNDIVYLTGELGDYSQTIDNTSYTLSREVSIDQADGSQETFTETVTFSVSDGDKVVFTNGAIDIGFTALDGFPELSDSMLDANETTPTNPLSIEVPGVADGGTTKVFIEDSTGENIAAGIRGSVIRVTGSSGDDTVTVGLGTQVDATGLTSSGGNDYIYLQGTFNLVNCNK